MVPEPHQVTDTGDTPSRTPREFVAAREALREARVGERLAALRARLPEVAHALAALGAERVWVFGSVEDGSFDEGSDLDLAVSGLPPERFLVARVVVTDLVPVELDLVELERAPPTLRAHILATGRELGDVG